MHWTLEGKAVSDPSLTQLEENANENGLELAAESVPAMVLKRGDVFIGAGDRLLLVTNDPYARLGYLVVATSNLEDRCWGRWEFRPLQHVTRVKTRRAF